MRLMHKIISRSHCRSHLIFSSAFSIFSLSAVKILASAASSIAIETIIALIASSRFNISLPPGNLGMDMAIAPLRLCNITYYVKVCIPVLCQGNNIVKTKRGCINMRIYEQAPTAQPTYCPKQHQSQSQSQSQSSDNNAPQPMSACLSCPHRSFMNCNAPKDNSSLAAMQAL